MMTCNNKVSEGALLSLALVCLSGPACNRPINQVEHQAPEKLTDLQTEVMLDDLQTPIGQIYLKVWGVECVGGHPVVRLGFVTFADENQQTIMLTHAQCDDPFWSNLKELDILEVPVFQDAFGGLNVSFLDPEKQ